MSSVLPQQACGIIICIDPPCLTSPDNTIVRYWDAAAQQFTAATTFLSPEFGWLDAAFNPVDWPHIPPGHGAWISFPSSFQGQAGTPRPEWLPVTLINPVRTESDFRFQFHADSEATYQVRRSAIADGNWQVTQMVAGPEGGGWVTVTDGAATGVSGYYSLAVMP